MRVGRPGGGGTLRSCKVGAARRERRVFWRPWLEGSCGKTPEPAVMQGGFDALLGPRILPFEAVPHPLSHSRATLNTRAHTTLECRCNWIVHTVLEKC